LRYISTTLSKVADWVGCDHVAGTDPTNALSKFTAKIEMKDASPSRYHKGAATS
jgi:hypothetical protein